MAEAKEKGGERADRKRRVNITVATVRTRVAQLIWIVCVVLALFLAVAALMVSLGTKIDDDNSLVEFVMNGADFADLGVFSIDDGVWDFVGKNSDTKNALANYGLAAIFWLVLGRVLDRIVRP